MFDIYHRVVLSVFTNGPATPSTLFVSKSGIFSNMFQLLKNHQANVFKIYKCQSQGLYKLQCIFFFVVKGPAAEAADTPQP